MKAMTVSGAASGPVLVEREIPRPAAQAGEVLVRVLGAGITPTELVWYPTSHERNGQPRNGAVPCHEFSGRVEETGAGVTGLCAGEEVYGMNDWFADGALAEYCVTRPEWIAPKPRRLSHAEAAAAPIGALTAWQGLFERGRLQRGEHVLVQGGAGAVGVFAIQLARRHGARVTATASARNLDFVKEIGASQAIDYRQTRFEEEVRDVDLVFDTVGGEVLSRSWSVLGQNGRLVTIAAGVESTGDRRAQEAFFLVEPNQRQLREIGRLLDGGELRAFVDAVIGCWRAAEAFTGAVARKGRGKVVAAMPEGEAASGR